MIRLFTLILFIAFTAQAFSQAQWMWATQMAGRNNTSGGAYLGKDSAGNIYLAGDFTDTRSFGSTNLIATGYSDAFVAQLDSSGNIIWAEKAGGNQATIDVRAAFTTPNGDTYITGKFDGTVNFGATSFTSTSAFGDMFIAQFDNNGVVNFAIRFGGSGSGAGYTEGRGIFADDAGNVWVTGGFSSTVDFGSYTLVAGHQFNTDMFVIKLSGGSVDWAQRGGSALQEDKGNAITVDAASNVYVTGAYQQTADFGSVTLTSTGVKDMFIVKYTAAGVVNWAVRAGGTSSTQPNNPVAAEANAIKVDQNNNIYVTGIMNGNNLIFGSGVSLNEIQHQGAFYGDFFVAKYNSSGVVQWAKNGGGSSLTDSGNALDLDADGNVYITGSFQGANANFNGVTLTSAGVGDAFVVRYTSTGTASWANSLGAGGDDVGLSIIVDANNKAYVSGYFTGNVTVGSSTISTAPLTWEVFLARMDAGSTSITNHTELPFEFYPNPASGILNIKGNGLTKIEITDQTGKLVYTSELNNIRTSHNISGLEKGIYFIKVSDAKTAGVRKLVVN